MQIGRRKTYRKRSQSSSYGKYIARDFDFFYFCLTQNNIIFVGSSWPNILFPKSYLNGLEIYKQIVSTFFALAYLCKHLSQVQTHFQKSLTGSVRRLDEENFWPHGGALTELRKIENDRIFNQRSHCKIS